jgi:alkylation response protein AidB-like acyl-CoA dehydrogenase
MDLRYGERYERFRAEVRAFLESHRERAPGGGGFGVGGGSREQSSSWQALLIEHGYAARTIPREYGGYGAEPDLLETVILDEEFTRAGVPRGLSGQGPGMLVPTLLEHGTEAQKRRWIAPTIRGETIWCQGYSEPDAGSDLASLRTRAKEDGDDFLINGQKIWTSGAQLSDMMFVLVRTEPDAQKHAGISYLLLSMDTPGIEVQPLRTMTGGAEFNQVFFTDVRVPKADVVGARGEGWRVANTTLRHERNMLGSAGQSESLLEQLVSLMKTETRNGVRTLDSPVLRDRLLRLQSRALSMKRHSMRLLTCALRGESPGVAGLIVKLQGCQLNHDIAALALDAMGELGALYQRSKYERARGMWQFQYMFSLGLIIGGGTAQIQKNIISERGLGLPREPKVSQAS